MNVRQLINLLNSHKYPVLLGTLIFLLFSTQIFGIIGNAFALFMTMLLLVMNGFNIIETSKKGDFYNRALVIITFAMSLFAYLFPAQDLFKGISFVLIFLYLLSISYVLFSQISKSKTVQVSEVLAAFAGYILIGYIGYFVFHIILLLDPIAFRLTVTDHQTYDDLVYYSFITLTTVGFGDITPQSFWAKRVTIILSLTGQFYLSIVIAIFIGKYLSRKSS